MLKGFKAFILRGNVVDLAVGVVIGAAFATLVTSFVEDILTPIIAAPGSTDFSQLEWGDVAYGRFLNALIAFLLIAAAVYFFVVVPVNKLMERRKTEPDVESTTRECPECLSSVPVGARRCAFCTASITAV